MTMKYCDYGTIPDDLEIDEPYFMGLNQEDLTLVSNAINQGIDSHLEAVSWSDTDGDKWHKNITIDDTKSMRCLLRRLFEAGDEKAERLAMDILYTLGYESI